MTYRPIIVVADRISSAIVQVQSGNPKVNTYTCYNLILILSRSTLVS